MPTAPSAAPELKFTPLDFKAVDPDGTFAGYASLFNKEDMGRDIVPPGAFRDSLSDRGPTGIKLLFQHNPTEPIGVWDTLKEDSRGLFARGRLMLEVARAREVLALMRAGALDGLSIGFRALKGRRDARTGMRRLEKVDLWEISVVTFPLLPEARVAHVKSDATIAPRPPTERESSAGSRRRGLTRSQARRSPPASRPHHRALGHPPPRRLIAAITGARSASSRCAPSLAQQHLAQTVEALADLMRTVVSSPPLRRTYPRVR